MTLGRLLLPCILLCGTASAQLLHPASPMPGFAVVSVRPANPNRDDSNAGFSADTYRAEGATIKDVLSYAFGLGYDRELVNAPSWVASQHFDITGKLEDDQAAIQRKLSRDDRDAQMRLRVQSMLVERFHLTYHFETRQLPVYNLEIAKNGLKCTRDTTSQSGLANEARPRFRLAVGPPPPPPPPGWHPASPEDQKSYMQSLHLRTKGWPFWLVVASLSHQPELEGWPVIDKTGLEGSYDCEMNWSQVDSEGTAQSFFSAVQDQLGLKFQPSKAPVEVLVIDSISQPSEN
jgi:uncharacterized protein (TIGR03435 family)